MTSLSGEQIYVAELKVPSCFRTRREARQTIPSPGEIGIRRGYWALSPPGEESDVSGYADLSVTLELVGANLRDAEDQALKIAKTFSSIVSAHAGYPVESPRLYRIASVDTDGSSITQHDYYYNPRPSMLSEFDKTTEAYFQDYLKIVSSIDNKVRYKLQSAIHWYVIAISADDPTVSYVAAWTGLESIGIAVDDMWHPNGTKVQCDTCGNPPGQRRDRKLAGITHMFNRLSSGPLSATIPDDAKELLTRELISGFSTKEAKELRHAIVHGLGEIEPLIQRSVDARRHLIHVLNASIQVVMGPGTKSWMTGDYAFHPDARLSVKRRKTLKYQPFFGQWIERPLWGSRPDIQGNAPPRSTVAWKIDAAIVESRSQELFKRNVDMVRVSDGSVLTELTAWDDRLEPLWEEIAPPPGDAQRGRAPQAGGRPQDTGMPPQPPAEGG